MKNTVYLVSGPLGIGKSTTTRRLNEVVDNSVLLEADTLFLALEDVESIAWEKRIQITWNNILSITKEYLNNNLNVIIDFVVEKELEWFAQNLENYSAEIKYIVLYAPENIIHQRLDQRGDIQYIERALRLNKQLSQDPNNRNHLLDVSNLTIDDIVKELTTSDKYIVN